MNGSEFHEYTDRYGLIHSVKVNSDKAPSTQNPLLYTSEAYILFALSGLNLMEVKPFGSIVKQCEIEPGLYKRHPECDDQEAHDDYTGLCAASAITADRGIAKNILNYGRNNITWFMKIIPLRYVYLNSPTGNLRKAWLGRMPQTVAHIRWAAGETPNLFQRLWWAAAIAKSAFGSGEDSDNWTLSWLLIQTYRNRATRAGCLLADFAVSLWIRGMKNRAISMQLVQWLYLGKDLNNPFYRYWEDHL